MKVDKVVATVALLGLAASGSQARAAREARIAEQPSLVSDASSGNRQGICAANRSVGDQPSAGRQAIHW